MAIKNKNIWFLSQFIGLFKFKLCFQNIVSMRIEIDFIILTRFKLCKRFLVNTQRLFITYNLPVFRLTHFELLYVLFLDDGMVGEYEQSQYAEQPSEGWFPPHHPRSLPSSPLFITKPLSSLCESLHFFLSSYNFLVSCAIFVVLPFIVSSVDIFF